MGGYYSGRVNWLALRNPLFISCTFLYVLHSVCKRATPEFAQTAFLKNYLNDLLFVPLALGIAVFLQRNFILKQPEYRLSKTQVIICVVYISIMFEGVIPLFKDRYTADFSDVLCYGFGGLLFYLFGNSDLPAKARL
jgi:glycopeptide antibiotics resistance protein